jgi:hypothetical protein
VALSALQTLLLWVKQRYGERWQLRAEVLKLVRTYQDSPADPRPFAGRAAVLAQLDEWLRQAGGRLLLVSAAAGRGKSALLLRWMESVIERRPELGVLYCPISIRFNTADEAAGVQLLFCALCDLCGEMKAGFPKQPEHKDYLEAIARGWQLIAGQSGRRFLLVVDGLDEAANRWFVERQILPREIPANLQVVIAARHKPGHATGAAWLADLCAGPTGSGQAAVLEVDRLGREAMAEAVIQLRSPLDRLAEKQAILDALYRLTDEGDPLLLTLWLGQIWRQRDAMPDLPAADLVRLQPSFGGFYRDWLRQQEAVWQERGLKVRAAEFEPVMQVLALARGPLLLSDLLAVLEHLGDSPWTGERLRSTLAAAHRLVVGDGAAQGYVFVHPRLAHHFQEGLEADPGRLGAVRQAFSKWGASTVSSLNSGALAADACPAYLLTHYVEGHLDEDNSAAGIEHHLVPLLQQGWPSAWHTQTGAWQGYLSDLDRVCARLHAYNQSCVQEARPGDLKLAEEMRCALLAATLRSLTSGLPRELMVCLVQAGEWSLARAARVARESDDPACLAELGALALRSGDPAAAQRLWEESLAACESTPDDRRGPALRAVVPWLRADGLLRSACDIACEIRDGWSRSLALSAVASHGGTEEVGALLGRILTAAVAVPDEHRFRPLCAVAARLEAGSPLLDRLAEAGHALQNQEGRAVTLAAMGGRLHGAARHAVLKHALDVAAAAEHRSSVSAVCAMAGHLKGDSALLQQALDIAPGIPATGLKIVRAVLEQLQLPGDGLLLRHALQMGEEVAPGPWLAQELGALAARVDGDPEPGVLEEVLRTAIALAAAPIRPANRADELLALAAQQEGEARMLTLQQALPAIADIHHAEDRADRMITVAAGLQDEARRAVLQQVLKISALLPDDSAIQDLDRASNRVLRKVAKYLEGDGELLQQALKVAHIVNDGLSRDRALGALASQMRDDRGALEWALNVLAGIGQGSVRADALEALAPQLRQDEALLLRALDAAAALKQPDERVRTLTALAVQMEGPARRAVLRQAIDAAGESARKWSGDWTGLCTVAEQLRGDTVLLHHVLDVAESLAEDLCEDTELTPRLLFSLAAEPDGAIRHRALQRLLDSIAADGDPLDRLPDFEKTVAGAWQDPALLERAQEVAAALMDESARALAQACVAGQLAGEARQALLQQALEGAAALTGPDRPDVAPAVGQQAGVITPDQRLAVQIHIAGKLEGEARQRLLRQVMEEAAQLGWLDARMRILGRLMGELPDDSAPLQRALEAVAAVAEDQRAAALWMLARELGGETRQQLLGRALAAAGAIKAEERRGAVLKDILGLLETGSPLLSVVREAAGSLQDGRLRRRLLLDLAAKLRGEAGEEVLEQVLAGMEPKELLEWLTSASTSTGSIAWLRWEGPAFQRLLEVLAGIEDEEKRSAALVRVAEELPGELSWQAALLEAAQGISGRRRGRIGACTAILRRCPGLLTYELWHKLLAQARLRRRLLLEVTGDLAGCAVRMTQRTQDIRAIALTVQQICGWWP